MKDGESAEASTATDSSLLGVGDNLLSATLTLVGVDHRFPGGPTGGRNGHGRGKVARRGQDAILGLLGSAVVPRAEATLGV